MHQDTVIVVDIGNTNTSLGLYRGLTHLRRLDVPTCGMTRVAATRTLRRLTGPAEVQGAVLGSVVPQANAIWRAALQQQRKALRLIEVSCDLNVGVPITYPKPRTIGADRLANACAAAHRYGAPVIVADFGTAVTFDVVDGKKGYIGGIIAPGLMLMFSYLAEKTALLPNIKPGPVRGRVGRSTEQAMRLGAQWGYRGLVREIVQELRRRPGLEQAHLCATGGYARWCLKDSDLKIAVDPHLTLYGLARIYQLNTQDCDDAY